MKKLALKILALTGVIVGGSVLLLPLSTYADNTANVTVNVTVAATISLELNTNSVSSSTLLPNSKIEGSDSNGFYTTATVTTNSATGYVLTVIDSDTNNALVSSSSASIPAVASTTLTAGTSAWGFRPNGETNWLSVPVSTGTAATVASSNAYSSSAQVTKVYYGVASSSSQLAGTYTDTVVYTATVH